MILSPLVAAFFVMLASLGGVIFASKALGAWMHGRLTYLATFSAGVLIVLAYHLVEEAFHEAESVAIAAGSVVAGIVILEIIHHLLPHAHHHHETHHDHAHTPVDGRRVLLSDALHNVTDGFIIVPAFIADWKIGIAATVGIFLHELVQEISEFFVLKEAGYSTKRALTLNFAASSTILIGVAIALTFASFDTLISVLAGAAAGGFLSVVVRDLLPHAVESAKANSKWLQHIAAALVGIALMTGVSLAVPHEDAHAVPLSCEDAGYCTRQV
jgi:zinc and cadmium transporter